MSGRRRLGRRFHVWQSNINYFYVNTQFNSFFISQTQLRSLYKNWWPLQQPLKFLLPWTYIWTRLQQDVDILIVLDFEIPYSRPEISSFQPRPLKKAMTKTRASARTKRARTRASESGVLTSPDLDARFWTPVSYCIWLIKGSKEFSITYNMWHIWFDSLYFNKIRKFIQREEFLVENKMVN